MRAREREPYTWLTLAPAELAQTLEQIRGKGLLISDRALLLATVALCDPRTLTARAGCREIRRLAGEQNVLERGGGGQSAGGMQRLQRAQLVAQVPMEAGGPGWMVSPAIVHTGGDPAVVRKRWARFRALNTASIEREDQRLEKRRAIAATEQQLVLRAAAA